MSESSDWSRFAARYFGGAGYDSGETEAAQDLNYRKTDDINALSDFQFFLRYQGFGTDSFDLAGLESMRKDWLKSRRRGKFARLVRQRARRELGPGRFWAWLPAGVYLNREFVKGWRGVNPRNP